MWIRSQDQTVLIDIAGKYIFISCVKYPNGKVDEYKLFVDDVASISANTKVLIGIYKKKQEATNILDRISNHIQDADNNRVLLYIM